MSDYLQQAIGGTSSFLSQWAGAETQKRAQEKQYKHDKSMAEYAYGKDLEMWERANEYNHPIQQMSRLESAGISPHLAYAKGAPQNVGASQLPKYQEVTANYQGRKSKIDPAAAFQLAMSGKLIAAQIKNLNSQTDKNSISAQRAQIQLDLDREWASYERMIKANIDNEKWYQEMYKANILERDQAIRVATELITEVDAHKARLALDKYKEDYHRELMELVEKGIFPTAGIANNIYNQFNKYIVGYLEGLLNKNK